PKEDDTMNTEAQSGTPPQARVARGSEQVPGARLGIALGVWVIVSVAGAGLTILGGRAFAPDWAANSNELATVIVFAVYAILIATLLLVFRGRLRATALALRTVSWRAYAMAFALSATVLLILTIGSLVAGAGGTVKDFYAFLGTDGGRLGLLGPIT